jgi:6-phosphogluconolactonase
VTLLRCLVFTFSLVILTILSGAVLSIQKKTSRKFIAYIGTFTGKNSKGIYSARFDAVTGELSQAALAAETPNPAFIAIHPNNRFLYAVNEVDEFQAKKNNGGVSAFAIDPSNGRLSLLNQQSSHGGAPCHLTIDSNGKHVLVANYNGGSVGSLPIGRNGELGEMDSFSQHQGSSVNRERQERPHAHGIYLDRSSHFALVPDLGLDRLLIYRFATNTGALGPNNPPYVTLKPGAGPRHLAFHPNGKFVYVNNELDSTVTAFGWDDRLGVLKELQTLSTLPDGFSGANSTSEIEVHPGGKFLYVSNRGHDAIAVFSIDQETGSLAPIEFKSTLGKTPRSFAIDPTGRFLIAANQQTSTLVVFRIDPITCRLTATGSSVDVGTPVCVRFLPVE